MEYRVKGVWRSYKAFYFSGKMEKHNEATFVEISVDEQGVLTLLHSHNRRNATAFPADQWRVEPLKGRPYLYLGKKQAYEIITLEPENLVLVDVVKGEKLFFAQLPGWHQRIEPIVTSVRHINPGTETENR